MPFVARLDQRTGALAGTNIALLFNMQNAHFFDPSSDKAIDVGKWPKVRESYERRAEDGC